MTVEKYKALLHQLTEELYNPLWLRGAVVYMATLTDKELLEVDGVLKLAKKGGEQ